MFLFSKLLTWLFLSPITVLLILSIILILLKNNRKKTAEKILFWTIQIGLLLSLRPIKDVFLIPLENIYPPQDLKMTQGQAIVVMGGGVINKSPEEDGPTLGASSLKRTYYAYRLWKVKPRPIIVTGGTPLATARPEAEVLARNLQILGVPSYYIIQEKHSRNTFENVKYIKRLMAHNKWQKLIVVTSAYHMPRTIMVYKHFKINTLAMPTDYLSDRASYSWYDLVPSFDNLTGTLNACHEYLGILFYKIRYRI